MAASFPAMSKITSHSGESFLERVDARRKFG
jgi:hypothetical protein